MQYTTCVNLEDMILCEIRQTQNNEYVSSHLHEVLRTGKFNSQEKKKFNSQGQKVEEMLVTRTCGGAEMGS